MIRKQLGQKIKQNRVAKGYSQEIFSKLSGLDRTYISDVEQGKRNISIDNIEKIAKTFDITVSELLDFSSSVQKTIIVNINNVDFLLESDKELTKDIKDIIEATATYFYDEDTDWYTEDLEEKSPYEIVEIFQEAVKEDTGINLSFKAIDLELKISDENY